MKKSVADLALFGAAQAFASTLPVGQINLPSQKDFVAAFEGIFSRRWYTNYGPLEQELEARLCEFLGVKNIILMTNATIGLAIAALALGLPKGGKVIVPSFTFAASAESLSWVGLQPLFCEVDPHTHSISAKSIRPHLAKKGVCAVLGVHLWGRGCDIENIEPLAAEHGLKVFYDSAHAIGCTYKGKTIGQFGACEVFSMHATKVLSAGEGGFVATNDDELAEIIRNMRSSYGHRKKVEIPVYCNGRFSEAQAAMALMSLNDFEKNCQNNKRRYELYKKLLAGVPGLDLYSFDKSERQNYQYVVLEVDEAAFGLNRDQLVKLLAAENVAARKYFVPGIHRSIPYKEMYPEYVEALPLTDELCTRVMQVPSGQIVQDSDIQIIAELIHFIQRNASEIKKRLS